MEVVGIQKVDFTNRSTKETVVGVKLYMTYRQEGVEGIACDSKFFAADSVFYRDACAASVGDSLMMSYSPKGKLIDFEVLPPVKK